MPALRAPAAPEHLALDGQTFAAWLDAEGFADPHLRWHHDYCRRDDYGAGTAAVSAWAGIHYFASRHGFHAPGNAASTADADAGVLTWPQGNGWLAGRLASPLGARLAFAHADWAGYSVFEEAFTRGHAAGLVV
ncbi:MAG: hypothetical protein GAK38_03691 [Xylophilus sp.]|nr:MAG: hypothetical protein GAK38_03691 [Xylophilus sp.]